MRAAEIRKPTKKEKRAYEAITGGKKNYGKYHKCCFHLHTPVSYDYSLLSEWNADQYRDASAQHILEVCIEHHVVMNTITLDDVKVEDEFACFDSPKELLSYLLLADSLFSAGIEIVLVADHNTIRGIVKLKAAIKWVQKTKRYNMFPLVMMGVEISCADRNHVVGIFDDTEEKRKAVDAWLNEHLIDIKDGVFVTSIEALEFIKKCGGIGYIAHINSSEILKRNTFSGGFKKRLLSSDLLRFVGLSDISKREQTEKDLRHYRKAPIDFILDNDAHDIDSVEHNCFWIKGGICTYTMVSEALNDYSISVDFTLPVCSKQYIKGLYVERSNDGFLVGRGNDDFCVSFSNALNCLIGGRGTGKSSVLEMLEYVLSQRCKDRRKLNFLCSHGTAWVVYEFTTFHQSYGYEEFIEGIRPAIIDEGEQADSGNIQYSVQPGIFKKFCEKAAQPIAVRTTTNDMGIRDNATIWKVSLWSTGDNEVRTECLKNEHIRIGWDQYGKDITDETDFSEDGGRVVLNAFMNKMQIGDIVMSCYSASTIDAIGIVTGEYEWHDEYHEFKRLRKVNWIIKNICENILEINGGTAMTLASVYRLSNIAISDVYKLIEKYKPTTLLPAKRNENYVFIIDEINRGNISKIFGELITLIEESKRIGLSESMKAVLPYSQKSFGVPENVYIIGTMNTADRSIATIDTALRRRFHFKEMMPRPDVLKDITVEGLSISDMLDRMNRRIAVLYDREHTIGHAYFVPLKDNPTIETLSKIFTNNIIPLLQEYFYEDYEKIRLVLGDNRKSDEEHQFIIARENDYSDLFGDVDVGLDDGRSYDINYSAFSHIEAYKSI